MTPAAELRGLTKDFAVGLRGLRLRAVRDLSLRIDAGQVYGLLGPNGSGKSTVLKLLLGLTAPTCGACEIFGVSSESPEARRSVGYLPDAPYFHRHLTGRELVAFHGRLSGMGGRELQARVAEVIDWVGLGGAAGRRIATYSKGMLQRIGLAQALVHRPRLVILDEPTAGVDPAGVAAMTEMTLRLKAEGTTVLLTSHLLGQVETICDHVALLDHGRLVWEGGADEFSGGDKATSLVGKELGPEDRAELAAWLGQRGCALAPAGRRRLERIFRERTEGRNP